MIKTSIPGSNKGFIVLISTLIVGAVGIAITASIILLGLSSSRTSFALFQHSQAYWLANACAEEALEQIRESTGYLGSGNLTLGQGACTYLVAIGSGEARTVTASGTMGTITSKLSISVSAINPKILVSSWQEVSN